MSDSCRFESQVLLAASEDRWTDALRSHLVECDECVATASVAPWMDRFARISDREHILPDPSVVWLKAKLLQQSSEVGRAARPLDVAQMLAYLVVAGGWAGLLMWRWPMIERWLRGFTPSGIMSTATSGQSLMFIALVFVLASMTVTLALHTILAED